MALIRRLFAAALVAGVLSGTVASVVQQVTTVPLILEAERYETGEAVAQAHSLTQPAHGHAAAAVEAAPTVEEQIQRVAMTVVADLLVGVGYALVLAGVMLLVGVPVDARRGLVWGIGGFVAFALAPAFGLPPEPPGMGGTGLEDRQLWWLAASFCAAAGLLTLAFAKNRFVIVAGVVLAALPHLIGAPHPEAPEGIVPPELAARFTALSLGAAALFWSVLGSACGAMMQRIIEPRR